MPDSYSFLAWSRREQCWVITYNNGYGTGIALHSIIDLRNLNECLAKTEFDNRLHSFNRTKDSTTVTVHPSLLEQATVTVHRTGGNYGDYTFHEAVRLQNELTSTIEEWKKQAAEIAEESHRRRATDRVLDALTRPKGDVILPERDWAPYGDGLIYTPKREKPYTAILGPNH